MSETHSSSAARSSDAHEPRLAELRAELARQNALLAEVAPELVQQVAPSPRSDDRSRFNMRRV